MLVGTPRPVNLSVFNALGPTLWIRRARFESWRGNCDGPLGAFCRRPFFVPLRLLAACWAAPSALEGQLEAQCGVDFRQAQGVAIMRTIEAR